MTPEPRGLIRNHGVSRRVRLVKRILCKIHHFVKYGNRDLLVNAAPHCALYLIFAVFALYAVDKVLSLLLHYVRFLFRHCTAHQVCASQRVAAKLAYNLHNLLLIHYTAICNVKNIFKQRMLVLYLAAVFAPYILRNRIHRSRTVERNPRDYILYTRRFKLLHKLRHAAAFKLKHAVGVPARNHFIRFRIVYVKRVNIDGYPLYLFDVFHRVTDNRKRFKTEKVHFKKTEPLYGRHGKLRCYYVILAHRKRNIRLDRLACYYNSRSVNRGMPRQSLQLHRHIDKPLNLRVAVIHRLELLICGKSLFNRHVQLFRYLLCNALHKRIRHIKRTPRVLYRLPRLHRTECNNLRNLVRSVLADYIVYYLTAAFVTEVYIYIRHGDALRIQKTLKNQVKFYRVDIRYLKTVGNYASRRAAPARTYHYAVLACKVYKIPHDKKIVNISHLLYRSEFVFKSCAQLFVRVRVTLFKAVLAQLSEVGF